MGFESYLETLARERKESARGAADYFTGIGRPAKVNQLGKVVQTDPTVNRLRALPPDLARRGVATNGVLDQMQKIIQQRPATEGGPTRAVSTPFFIDVQRDLKLARVDRRHQRNMKKK